MPDPRHAFVAQPGCNLCVCGFPRTAPEHVTDAQVDAVGRLFARIMDKRDGIGSQAAVEEAVDVVIAEFDPT